MSRLKNFAQLLLEWNKSINLVAPTTGDGFWQRHVIDSAQLMEVIPQGARTLIDLGSGGGLPGVVVAILSQDRCPQLKITLVEADLRKSIFLRETLRKLGLDATVVRERIETAVLPKADVITARALAPLEQLYTYAHPLCHADTNLLFLKGRKVDNELTKASQNWHSLVERRPSLTHPDGVILNIRELRKLA